MKLTEKDLEELNIDKFIEQCVKLDAVEMLLRCQNFGVLVQGINLLPNDFNRNKIVVNFTRFIIHLQLIIAKHGDALRPIGMSEEDFLKVKPIVEKLVASGYLKKLVEPILKVSE